MHFNNANYRNEYERLQIELLKAELDHKKEKAEEQRIANVAARRIHGVSERILPAPMPAPGSFFGTGTGTPIGDQLRMVTNDHKSLY